MNRYELSLAKHIDIPKIMDIYRSLIGTPGCTWNEYYPDNEIVEQDINNNSLYTLTSDGDILAVATVCQLDELKTLDWKPQNPCEFARLAVKPSLHKQGIGTTILQHIMQVAKDKGHDGVVMLVSKENIAALALHEKYGFVKCGETHMYDIDFYCYQLMFG